MKKYNMSEIMKKAWAKFKEVRRRFYRDEYQRNATIKEYTFSYCLKLAWREVKASVAFAAKMAKIVAKGEFRCRDDFWVSLTSGIVSGRHTYSYRSDFKACGFKWQYVGAGAYTYNRDGFAWVGNDEAIEKLIKRFS